MYKCKHRHLASSEPCAICHAERRGKAEALDDVLEVVKASVSVYQAEMFMLAWESQLLDGKMEEYELYCAGEIEMSYCIGLEECDHLKLNGYQGCMYCPYEENDA